MGVALRLRAQLPSQSLPDSLGPGRARLPVAAALGALVAYSDLSGTFLAGTIPTAMGKMAGLTDLCALWRSCLHAGCSGSTP